MPQSCQDHILYSVVSLAILVCTSEMWQHPDGSGQLFAAIQTSLEPDLCSQWRWGSRFLLSYLMTIKDICDQNYTPDTTVIIKL